MPEPGVNDRNFSRPTTKFPRRPVGNRAGGRKPQIPGEYAEFRLEDGRYLGEVLEPDFFGPQSGQVTEEQREDLRVGNYAPARYGRDQPERVTAPAGPATSEDDNDAQFVNLPFGPEDGEGKNGTSGFPVAKPRPTRGSAEEPENARGFHMFDLPLTTEGAVDEGALVPGAVYRIPESAGGGAGRWTNGLFYSFGGKADWNSRSAADLDAYSGASDEPTPEERWKKIDNVLMPATLLDKKAIDKFREISGYDLTRTDDGFSLADASGQELFDLGEEDAAELVRIWSPEIAKRVAAIGLIWREDLTPEEKRRLLAQEVYVGEADAGRVLSRSEYMAHIAKSAERNLARKRLQTYDALAAAMAGGASDEEIGALLGEFHAAMLPEMFGGERFVRDLLKDLAPGLGNIRSIRHLRNDIAEVRRAVATGKWDDATMASGMAVLDAIGIFPGGNFVKQGGKLAGRGLVRSVPYLDGLLAERTIRRFKAQWGDTVNKIDPKTFVGALFDELDPVVRNMFRGLVNNRVGHLSEAEVFDIVRRMDADALDQVEVHLPGGLPTKTRIYDYEARFLSEVLAAKNAMLGRLARWVGGAGDRALPRTLAQVKRVELKTGNGRKSAGQTAADRRTGDVLDLRRDPGEIPIDFVIHDLSNYLDGWVKKGRIGRYEATALKEAMKKTWARGVTRVAVEEYAGLLARLAAATSRHADTDNIARPELGEDPYP